MPPWRVASDIIVFTREEHDALVYEKDYKLAAVSIKNASEAVAKSKSKAEKLRVSRHVCPYG